MQTLKEAAVAAAAAVLTMLAILTAITVLDAAHAKADDTQAYAYAAAYGPLVCEVLSEHPSISGILGIGQAIHEEEGYDYGTIGQIITISVSTMCPEHSGLMNRFIQRYGSNAANYKVA